MNQNLQNKSESELIELISVMSNEIDERDKEITSLTVRFYVALFVAVGLGLVLIYHNPPCQ